MFLTKPILPVNPVSDAEAMSTFQQTRTPRIWRGQLKLMDNSKIEMFDLVDAPHHCPTPDLLLSQGCPRLHSPGQYPCKNQGSGGLLVTK